MTRCRESRIQLYPVLCFAVLVCLSVHGIPAASAQPKTACDLLSEAQVESILGETVEVRERDNPSICIFRLPGKFSSESLRISVLLSGTPTDPDAVNRVRRDDEQERRYVNFKDIPGLGDAAYWAYSPQMGGVIFLRVFQGGKTILTFTSFHFADQTAELEKVRKLVLIALGGPGKTGYAYAPPGKPVSGSQAGSGAPQSPKKQAIEEKVISESEALRGLTAFSVRVVSNDVDTDPVTGRMTQALKGHGITVLPPDAYPEIVVAIQTVSMSVNTSAGRFTVPASILAYSVTLEVIRLVPVGTQFMSVGTNYQAALGIGGPLVLKPGIQNALDSCLKGFFKQYDASTTSRPVGR